MMSAALRSTLAALLTVSAIHGQPLNRAKHPPRFHDPSTPVRDADAWWIFATGNGVVLRRSTDLKQWNEAGSAIRPLPAWHTEVVPAQKGHLWAPDIIRHGDHWRLYYSVSDFGKNTSAIGLATSPTIDPANPNTRWKDHGIVVRSNKDDNFNAIDPHLIIDSEGRHWMSFGSFWGGIQLIELDPVTGLRHPERRAITRLAWNETIEAPAILRHGGFYHLFVNWGLCCRGVNSTYEIRVGRSRNITGPYLDKQGRDLATGGGTLLLGNEGPRIGPGHASFLTTGGETQMFYHYYDRNRAGAPSLASKTLRWDADGWPLLR